MRAARALSRAAARPKPSVGAVALRARSYCSLDKRDTSSRAALRASGPKSSGPIAGAFSHSQTFARSYR